MCRSIKRLNIKNTKVTNEEVEAAAKQFVRKVSGFREPSQKNKAAFEAAVEEIKIATQKLLTYLDLPSTESQTCQ